MNHAGEATLDGFPAEMLSGKGSADKTLRSLAIVGSHPATRELAPYDDAEYDIWLFNEAPQKPTVYRRWDASFQLHLPEVYASNENWVNKDHWSWLQEDHGERVIWMQEVDPRVPNSRRYPLEEILKMVPYRYLRSTPAEALALAIHLGYRKISLYGSELTSNTEYTYQAINYAFWIGFAIGQGVELDLQCWKNEFYEQPIYGYEGELEIPREFYLGRMKEFESRWRDKKAAYELVQGKLEKAMQAGQFEKVGEISLTLENLAISTGEAFGALSEAKRYYERTNFISRQEFERVSAQAQLDGREHERKVDHAAGKSEYVWNVWRQSGRIDALNQLRMFLKEKTKHAHEAGVKSGVFSENMNYLSEYDKRVTAAGGQRAVLQAALPAGGNNGKG